SPPTVVVVLKPDHVRDVDLFVRRYRTRAFGPSLFWRDDIPETSSTRSSPAWSFPAVSSLSMTEEGTSRGRSGCPNNARSSSATR
ncbi:MAG: hypothetical protein ACRDNP_07620, partial [Gaiellaceae bacterium]